MQEEYVTVTFFNVKRSKADEIMAAAKQLAPGTEFLVNTNVTPIVRDRGHNTESQSGQFRKRLA